MGEARLTPSIVLILSNLYNLRESNPILQDPYAGVDTFFFFL